MQNYKFEDYESAMKELRDEIYSIQDELAKEEFSYGMDKAGKDYLNEARNAYVNYKNALNPYGTKKESLTLSGLGSSGKEINAFTDSFSEYQSHLSRALKEREDITANLVKELLTSQQENDEQRKKGALEDAKARLDNYWKEYQWAYRLQRDKLEDERYEKELKAKYGV